MNHVKETRDFHIKVDTALFGDDEAEIPGLAKRVKAAEKYIETDKKLKTKIAGGIAVGTPLLVVLWDRIQHWAGWK